MQNVMDTPEKRGRRASELQDAVHRTMPGVMAPARGSKRGLSGRSSTGECPEGFEAIDAEDFNII